MWWTQFAGVEAEHQGLVTSTHELIDVLADAPDRFGTAMVDYTYTLRVANLARHLNAVGDLFAGLHYASGFAVLRTALEHALVDTLLLNATKRRDRYEDVNDEWEQAQRQAWEAGVEGTGDVESITRHGRAVLVVRGAHPYLDAVGEVVGMISPYHVAMDHHSPLVGRRSDQHDRWAYVGTVDERRAHADRNALWWHDYLAWPAVKDNLVLNGFYSERDVRRIDVHYGFLSAFTHAHNDGYRIVHSDDIGVGGCHFCCELALLYMGTAAAIEGRAVRTHCSTNGDEAVDWLEDLVEAVERSAAHLWFPPGEPSDWDRHRHVTQLRFEAGQIGPPVLPHELNPDDIPYYSDPMRLVDLHQTVREMTTGLTYQSPWPRPLGWIQHP